MSSLVDKPTIFLKATLELNDIELRGLERITQYDIDKLIAHIGEYALLEPVHRAGLKEFFDTIHKMGPGIVERFAGAKRVLTSEVSVFDPTKYKIVPKDYD